MRFRTWARGAAGRALIALGMVAVVVAGGWLFMRPSVTRTVLPAAVPENPGAAAGQSGPSALQVSAPVQAQAPQQQGANALQAWAANLSGPLDIPERALIGYATAELTLRREQPGCHLSWVTLAGVGKASSDHGRYGGDQLGPDGTESRPLGPTPLQGAAGEAAADQRGGPMQLTQQQFNHAGNIQSVDDAAIAAGRALCAKGTDLQVGQGWWNAIAAYRDSPLFRQQVLGNAQLYATLSLAPATASAPSARAIRFALDQIGLPYVWGGNGPKAGAAGFDCSGLSSAAYQSAGIGLPRTADSQFRAISAVPGGEQPKMGDLVFYGNAATFIHHVGIYLGNGLMINAPTEGMAVQIATYHVRGDDYVGAGRPAN
ncbi:C40 family peptidase [Amycolatopsis pigmentata]|uniref:C40 family peptidase n=1 Tax=Amycolatopsis pigmentata TaxID=450801 RepID=A0ABW5G7M2_9PSEU